jgi:hypothetical protein
MQEKPSPYETPPSQQRHEAHEDALSSLGPSLQQPEQEQPDD